MTEPSPSAERVAQASPGEPASRAVHSRHAATSTSYALAAMYVAVLLAAGVLWSTVRNPADPDLWHRLATGKLVWEAGAVPMHDVFSWRGKGAVVEDHEWLTGVLFYPLWQAAGRNAFVWVKVALCLAIVFILAPPRRRLAQAPPCGAPKRDITFASLMFSMVLIFALLPDLVSTIRCHAFTLLFWAAWLVWLEGARRTGRVPWAAIIATSVLWSNMHGGYVAGLGLLFVYAAGEWLNGRGRAAVSYAALGSASALSTLINPYGTGMWTSTVNAVFVPHPDFATWHATVMTDISDPGFKILLLLSVAGIIPELARLRLPWRQGGALGGSDGAVDLQKRGDWTPVLVMTISAVMALRQSRNGGLFAICAALWAWPWMCALWHRAARCRRAGRRLIGLRLWQMARTTGIGLTLVMLAALLFAAVSPGQFVLHVSDAQYAPRAVAWLEKNLPPLPPPLPPPSPTPASSPAPAPAPRAHLHPLQLGQLRALETLPARPRLHGRPLRAGLHPRHVPRKRALFPSPGRLAPPPPRLRRHPRPQPRQSGRRPPTESRARLARRLRGRMGDCV